MMVVMMVVVVTWRMTSPECQRCQTPRVGAVRPSSKHHTRQVVPGRIVDMVMMKVTKMMMMRRRRMLMNYLEDLLDARDKG